MLTPSLAGHRVLQVVLQPLSPHRVHCTYILSMDMRAPLPKAMVNLATTKVVGAIFHKLAKEAKQIRQGAAVNAHAQRMAEESAVYEAWILPRMMAALETLKARLTSGAPPVVTQGWPEHGLVESTPPMAQVM